MHSLTNMFAISETPQPVTCYYCHDIPTGAGNDSNSKADNCATVTDVIRQDSEAARTKYGKVCHAKTETGEYNSFLVMEAFHDQDMMEFSSSILDVACFRSKRYRGCGDRSFVEPGKCRTIPGTQIEYCNCKGSFCNSFGFRGGPWVPMIIGGVIVYVFLTRRWWNEGTKKFKKSVQSVRNNQVNQVFGKQKINVEKNASMQANCVPWLWRNHFCKILCERNSPICEQVIWNLTWNTQCILNWICYKGRFSHNILFILEKAEEIRIDWSSDIAYRITPFINHCSYFSYSSIIDLKGFPILWWRKLPKTYLLEGFCVNLLIVDNIQLVGGIIKEEIHIKFHCNVKVPLFCITPNSCATCHNVICHCMNLWQAKKCR